jgi:hypothetical protein
MGVLDMLKEVLIGAAGLGVGYLVARNQLEKRYARLLDEEVRRTKEFFEGTQGEEYTAPTDPEFMDQAIQTAEAMTEYSGGETVVNPAVLAQEVTKTVKAYNKPGAPTIEEKASDIESNVAATPTDPDAREPYMIPFAEFDANETGAEQITVSFFAGDGIVIDEDDNVVSPDRVEQIIGTDNLNRFGTLTTDPAMEPNVIYVRCERFNMDFEVTRSPGKHSVEVLGQTG